MPQTRTHVLLDMKGYARFVETHGDATAARAMRTYERVVRRLLPRRGAEVDHAGDSFHLAFSEPARAVRTARAIADALERYNRTHPDLPLPISFGIAVGQPVRHRRLFYGAAPVLAARLAMHARAGQILATETAANLLRSAGILPLRDLGAWKPPHALSALRIYEMRPPDDPNDRQHSTNALLAVLHTDIEASTAKAIELGGQRWGELVERHHEIVRQVLQSAGGVEVDTAGDGFYATFTTAARAIDAAITLRDRIWDELHIAVRVGVHVGECEIIAGKVGGVAVTIGARVRDKAAGNEIFVSQVVRDVLLGHAYEFRERGSAALKGLAGDWVIYEVLGSGHAPARS